MSLVTYRKSKGMTQAQFASAMGLRSKGHWSRVERGLESCPLKLALRIENESDGIVGAVTLVTPEEAALLRGFGERYAMAAMTSRSVDAEPRACA